MLKAMNRKNEDICNSVCVGSTKESTATISTSYVKLLYANNCWSSDMLEQLNFYRYHERWLHIYLSIYI